MKPIEIDTISPSAPRYSICTLVSDIKKYQAMVTSFEQAGFSEETCEFLYVDNSQTNKYDAYTGMNKLITAAKGDYIILCHQDVLLNHDNCQALGRCIQEMDELDPNWAVLGNSGGVGFNKGFARISDPFGQNRTLGKLPGKVASLDENFMLIRREANLGLSNDLSGFHLYGTDICLMAAIRGYSCYVINFHLTHESDGLAWQDVKSACQKFIVKYQKSLASRFVNTNCKKFFISGSRLKNKIFNHPAITKKIKRLYKLKILK